MVEEQNFGLFDFVKVLYRKLGKNFIIIDRYVQFKIVIFRGKLMSKVMFNGLVFFF